jgi:hypothetical protein
MIATATPADADVSAAGVPVYPGSVVSADPVVWGGLPGRIAHERLQDRIDGMPLRSMSEETYTAPAPPKQVAAYLRKSLGGVTGSPETVEALNPMRLAPGTSTPVQHYSMPGSFGVGYYSVWYRCDEAGDVTMFQITTGTDYKASEGGATKSFMHLVRKDYSARVTVDIPGPETLGVPSYPSSVFDSPESTILPNDVGATYTFRTNDPARKVAAFYQSALPATAFVDESDGGDSWMIKNYSPRWVGDTILIQEAEPGGTDRGLRTKIEIILMHY